MISVVSSIWFLAVVLSTGILVGSILAGLWPSLPSARSCGRVGVFLAVAASALLLLRPHEDTFTGLDTSCYRLMGRAFVEGRGFHDVDTTLLSMPPDQRRAVLLEYQLWGRDTRDRSFEIPALATCVTQPYFYPFLPLAAAGLEIVTRGISGDFFVPVMGLLLFTVILFAGAAAGRKIGWIAAAALLIGSPLPAYFFRGYHAEAVGAALACLVLTGLSCSIRRPSFRLLAPVVLGLAVCFHPVSIALSLPALVMILADPTRSRRGVILSLAGFALGLLPLLAATLWVCQPYGDIANIKVILHNLSVNAVHRLLAIFAGGFAIAIGVVGFSSTAFKERIRMTVSALLKNRFSYLLLLLMAATPLLIPVSLWPGKGLAVQGIREFHDAVRWGYGLLLAVGVISTFLRDTPLFPRAMLFLTVLLSPLFFYLKGFEQMGLWSQRRLLPLALLLIVALTPALSALCNRFSRLRWIAVSVTAILAGAALSNPIRWPAPWLVRHEQGTQAWVARVSKKIGTPLTVFDYHPYAVPFSLMNPSRVIGLSAYGAPALPGLMSWLATRSSHEPVHIVTAYSNPGVEDGMVLTELSHEVMTTRRVVSKTSLPAESRLRTFDMTLMEARPATGDPAFALHKILDDGLLALRGPWGRGSPIQAGEALLPARWSREGSGIIGPLPRPGQSITIALTAAASRDDGEWGQTLRIQPPWDGSSLSLPVSNDLTRVAGALTRPDVPQPDSARTGIYRIYSKKPYNPNLVGIRGYESDLGARIHSITITLP